VTIDPGVSDFPFVVTEHDGKRALILRDAQHEYAFLEAAQKQAEAKSATSSAPR